MPWQGYLLVLIAGILMTGSAYFGIKSLTIISYIAVPAVAILGTVAMIMAVNRGDAGIIEQFNSGSKTDILYALTNGVRGRMWKAMKENRSAYQCPIHFEAVRKATGTPPGWSYVMNCEFGREDTKRDGSFWGQTQTSISIPRKNYKSSRTCHAEKVLMFAELQGADVNEPGCDPIQAASYLKASGRQADGMLEYDKGECIGFNHKTSKRGYSGHVAFADGHVERLAYPKSGSGLSIKDLTEKLCRGHELTFDGKGYADLTTDDN